MIEWLILISCVLVFCQPTLERVLVAAMYVVLCAGHMAVAPLLTDMVYYVSAGSCDIMLGLAILLFFKRTRFTDGMITVAFFSFLTNLYGWSIYNCDLQPTSFVAAFFVVYALGIFVLLRKDKVNESDNYNWMGFFRVPVGWMGCNRNKLYRKAGTWTEQGINLQ